MPLVWNCMESLMKVEVVGMDRASFAAADDARHHHNSHDWEDTDVGVATLDLVHPSSLD